MIFLRLAVTLFSLLLLSIALAPSMDRLSVPVQRLSAPSQSFTLKALTPTLNASQGMLSFSTIMVTGYGGYTGNVSLSVASGSNTENLTVSFNPTVAKLSAAQPSVNSTITIFVSPRTLSGTNYIVILGYDGASYGSTDIYIYVTGLDFAISAHPSRLTFTGGVLENLQTTVQVTSADGFSGDVNMTMSVSSNFPGVYVMPLVAPNSTKVSLTPAVSATFQLMISVNASVLPAPYNVQITGVVQAPGRVLSHAFFVSAIVGPDFTMSTGITNVIVHQGAMAVSTITFTSLNGLVGGIMLEYGPISVQPPNPSTEFFPSYPLLAPDGTNTTRLVVSADSRTGLGTYVGFVEATVGWIGRSLAVNITVEGPVTGPDFTIYVDPVHISTSLGSTVTSTINLLGTNGFTGPLTLFAGYGIGASLNPTYASLIPRVNATSTLTVDVPLNRGEGGGYTLWWFASGVYSTLVIASDSTGFAHGAWVNVTATPFTVVASPASQGLKAGSTAQFNVRVNGIGQFNDTVSLSAKVSGVNPAAQIGGSTSDVSFLVSANLSKSVLNFSGAPTSLGSNLTVSVLSGTPDGTYVVWVTATYLRPEYICSCAPKDALAFTLPVQVLVTSTASAAPTIFGLQPAEFYGIVAAAGAGAVILSSYLVVRRGKPTRTTDGGPGPS